jgi:hypothetical protein
MKRQWNLQLKRNQNTVTFSCKENSQNAVTIVSSHQRIKIQFHIFSIITQIHERQRRYKTRDRINQQSPTAFKIIRQIMRSKHSNIFQSFHCIIFIIRQSDSLKKQRLLADLRSTNERLKILRYRNLKNCGHQNHKETVTTLIRPQQRLSYFPWCSLSGCKRIKVSLTK